MQVQNDATAPKLYSDIIHVDIIKEHIKMMFPNNYKKFPFQKKVGYFNEGKFLYDMIHIRPIASFSRLVLIRKPRKVECNQYTIGRFRKSPGVGHT